MNQNSLTKQFELIYQEATIAQGSTNSPLRESVQIPGMVNQRRSFNHSLLYPLEIKHHQKLAASGSNPKGYSQSQPMKSTISHSKNGKLDKSKDMRYLRKKYRVDTSNFDRNGASNQKPMIKSGSITNTTK